MPRRTGMGPVIAVGATLDAQKQQRVGSLVAQQCVVAEMPAEDKRIDPACRLQQIIASAADKHIIAPGSEQMIIAALPQQPAAVFVGLERAVTGPRLHRSHVIHAGIA